MCERGLRYSAYRCRRSESTIECGRAADWQWECVRCNCRAETQRPPPTAQPPAERLNCVGGGACDPESTKGGEGSSSAMSMMSLRHDDLSWQEASHRMRPRRGNIWETSAQGYLGSGSMGGAIPSAPMGQPH